MASPRHRNRRFLWYRTSLVLFFVLLFTPLGDSMAASGRQTLLLSTASDPRQRQRLATLVDAGQHLQPIEYCPAEAVAHMPCEDPRRNSQLSREMNFYRERHFSLPEETPLCLIPPPAGYKIPVPWPESLHKARGVRSAAVAGALGGLAAGAVVAGKQIVKRYVPI